MPVTWLTDRFFSFLRTWFGDFTKQELKQYALLGLIFFMLLGTHWTLRPLKDAIFGSVVGGGSYLAMAKIVSLILLFPIIALCSKLMTHYARHRLLYVMGTCYVVLLLAWGMFFALPHVGLTNTITTPWRISGWLWYVFVESFGSLMLALFWAFTTDISDHKSARYGFPLIALIGQLGGVVAPAYLTKLPQSWGTTNAPLVALLSLLVLGMMVLFTIFLRVVPLKKSAHTLEVLEKEPEKAGFFCGLKLLARHKYLMGIFAILFIFEVMATFLDFNFKIRVIELLTSDTARSAYLGDFASITNIVTFFCILFGINNIARWFGMRAALVLTPLFIGFCVVLLNFYSDVSVLFWLVVGAKTVAFALNSPTLKQLYIPTSVDVKYRAQSWIETFGPRSAKACASGINVLRGVLGTSLYLSVLCVISGGVLVLWFFVAAYLSQEYNDAIKQNRPVF